MVEKNLKIWQFYSNPIFFVKFLCILMYFITQNRTNIVYRQCCGPDPVENGTFLDRSDPDPDQTFLTKNLFDAIFANFSSKWSS
jgi:hypothetical protein